MKTFVHETTRGRMRGNDEETNAMRKFKLEHTDLEPGEVAWKTLLHGVLVVYWLVFGFFS